MVLPSNLTMYLGVALLLALAATGYNYQRAERFKEQAEAALAATRTVGSELKAVNANLARCSEANRKLYGAAQEAHAQMQVAAATAEHFAQEAAKARLQMQQKEEQDRANPKCQIFLESDLADACPGHTASMRDRARRSLQRSRGDRPDAGTRTD